MTHRTRENDGFGGTATIVLLVGAAALVCGLLAHGSYDDAALA